MITTSTIFRMDFDLEFFDLTVKDVLKDTLKSRISTAVSSDEDATECANNSTIEESNAQNDENKINTTMREEKRMRNRLAARKCREKRKQRILYLEKICYTLENRMVCLQNEVHNLLKERDSLTRVLSNHWCVSKTSGNSQSSDYVNGNTNGIF